MSNPDFQICVVDCGKDYPECKCRNPYTHHGASIYGSKIADYLVSELHLMDARQDIFTDKDTDHE